MEVAMRGGWLAGLVFPGAVAAMAAEVPVHTIPRLSVPPKLDGVLDDPAWSEALSLSLAVEVNPGENVPALATTDCRLGYDDANLYLGCRCADPSPDAIRARLSDHDRAFQDDFVGMVIDTFDDGRRAYEFFVNPLGVQMDLVMDDVSGNEDSSWDGLWDSAGRPDAQGYVVEMAIPFRTLRFQPGGAGQRWGLDLVRAYPREQRRLFSINPRDRGANCYLCLLPKLQGFTGVRPGANLEVTPTLTAGRQEEREPFPDGKLETRDRDVDPGVTARWGMTPNLTALGTINPDFSQVEADSAQLDVNTTFALFFPEKRPFFLESADFFETPLQAVYTRRVGDPAWGAKLTGKVGRQAFGFFTAEDQTPSVLLPESERSSLAELRQDVTVGVARYRRDLGKSSTLGGLVTVREGEGYHNRVLGVDGVFRPSKTDSITFQVLGSQTQDVAPIASVFGLPAEEREDRAIYARYGHDTRNWSLAGNYTDIGEDFRADLGFLPQANWRKAVIGGERRFWRDGKRIRRFDLYADWDQTEDQDGNLLEREIEGSVDGNGPWQSYFAVGGGRRTRVFQGLSFDQNFQYTSLYVVPAGGLELSIDGQFGDTVDFVNVRNARETVLSPNATMTFGRHVKAQLAHTLFRLRVEGGTLVRAGLTDLRLVHQFTVRQFVRAIVQYQDVKHDRSLYLADRVPEDARTRDLVTQLLYSYKLNPQTVLFLGYSDGSSGTEDLSPRRRGRTVFGKLSYAWVR
jgi:hypothetical protein